MSVLLAVLLCLGAARAQETGEIRGVVVNVHGGEPLGRVRVQLAAAWGLRSPRLHRRLQAAEEAICPGRRGGQGVRGQREAGYHRVGLYLDDVLVHMPFHMVASEPSSGSMTAFNSDMMESLSLHSGAYPPRFADRTAGALDVHTRQGSRLGPSVRLTASASNAGVLAEGPLGSSRRGAWLASARNSYL